MIFSPEYGDIAFTVPMFDEFMRRSMPNWTIDDAVANPSRKPGKGRRNRP